MADGYERLPEWFWHPTHGLYGHEEPARPGDRTLYVRVDDAAGSPPPTPMADEPQNEALAAELEKAGLLRDEYPDQMAQRSCTCEPDAVCGAHRLLARYDELFTAFQQSNREKREAKRALRDLALLSAGPAPPLWTGVTMEPGDDTYSTLALYALPVPPGTAVEVRAR